MRQMKLLVRVAFGIFLSCQTAAQAEGRLVIAGGAVSHDNEAVWQAFIDGLPDEGAVYVIPAASSSPQRSAQRAKAALAMHGLDPSRILVAPLAVRDDRDTKGVNEAKWRKNAKDSGLAEGLARAAGLWFTGGDQLRITDLLLGKGEETLTLAAIRQAHKRGAVIGGTSAGAAIMSELMIFGGDSLSALRFEPALKEGKGLLLTEGLGFFPYGVVDQHFGERGRLGRLIRAVATVPDLSFRLGFGVDEDTALIVDGPRLAVVGEGYVTVVDGTGATLSTIGERLAAEGIALHLLGADDIFDLGSGAIAPAAYRASTLKDPYNNRPILGGGGMAFGQQSLASVIGDALLDNSASQQVVRDSFDETGAGVRYIFRQPKNALGFWGRPPDGDARYTVIGVQMSLFPITVTIEEIKE